MQYPLTIGILSWGAHNTLKNTLESYKKHGLLELAAQRFIFFQEKSIADIEIAHEYGFDAYGSHTNLGIAGGYRAMLGYVTEPYYLFLENDWAIIEEPYALQRQISGGILFTGSGLADVVRYRHRRHPGNPLWTAQFQGNEMSRPEHLLDCLHWRENPDLDFPGAIFKGTHGWYGTLAAYANWTNNPHMVRAKWAREVLLPRLGDRDIELDLQEWWKTTGFVVAQGDGLFTHWRLG